MKQSPGSAALFKKQLLILASVLVAVAGAISVSLVGTLSSDVGYIVAPALATVLIFVLFSIALKWQVGDNLFGELGFMYLGLAVAYTLFPAFVLTAANLSVDSWDLLSRLLPSSSELGLQLWRHALFVFGVAAGYLAVRGRGMPQLITNSDPGGRDDRTIAFLIAIIVVTLLFLTLMSAPVASYYDNYTRYDHLAWLPRKLVSVATRLKLGVYSVLITFLFLNYKKYKRAIPVVVLALCIYETVDSFGSRIVSLMILMAVLCMYNYTVKSVTFKRGLLVCGTIAVLFSGVELFRASGFSVQTAADAVSDQGVRPASEFGAVYLTGFHLYQERAGRTLPPRPWPMFFYDFLSPFVFSDYATRWDPQYWYAKNYFPDAVVPPQTLGPIAISALWGGEIDLFVRSVINGIFFAWLVRWFLARRDKWWGVVVYVYCYATCVMTLKYSVFYVVTPLLKSVVPSLLIVEVGRRLMPSKSKSVDGDGGELGDGSSGQGTYTLRPASH